MMCKYSRYPDREGDGVIGHMCNITGHPCVLMLPNEEACSHMFGIPESGEVIEESEVL